ncbi:MAG: fibronectin type III domain-containing protein, partial [Clostridia bacterium]|nr:fibronectin type III domain-containing protein [Clostridia bacterium]
YINYPSTGNYNFKITFSSAYETNNEYNNSIINSSPINFNTLIKGQIAENDREDYYKITLSYNTDIAINITSYMKNYCIYIYDAAGKNIWTKEENKWVETTGKRVDTHKITLSKGTYYIKITGYAWYINYPSTGNYTLSIKEYIYVPKVDKIKVSSESTSSHTIKWSKTTDVTGYELYRYNSSTKKYEKIKTTSSTKYKASKLKSGTTYKYKVRAYIKKNGATHYGAYSSVLSAGTKPAKTTLSSVKSSKPAQLTVTWKTVKGASGYQVFCSTSKKFTSKTTKKVTVKKQTSKKTTVKKLKKGKKYYIRVRAYKTVGGKNLYGAYSTVKSAKIKK